MIVGSTWNAKIKPREDFCLPSSPNTNSEPKKAKLRSLFAPFPAYSKIVRPIAKRRTKNANSICKPNPQRTVFRRMALRFAENRYARPSIVARPSNPVNRPMRSPSSYKNRVFASRAGRHQPNLQLKRQRLHLFSFCGQVQNDSHACRLGGFHICVDQKLLAVSTDVIREDIQIRDGLPWARLEERDRRARTETRSIDHRHCHHATAIWC